jgi:hypothetical protein
MNNSGAEYLREEEDYPNLKPSLRNSPLFLFFSALLVYLLSNYEIYSKSSKSFYRLVLKHFNYYDLNREYGEITFLIKKMALLCSQNYYELIYLSVGVILAVIIRYKLINFISFDNHQKGVEIRWIDSSGLTRDFIDITQIKDCDLEMGPWQFLTLTYRLKISSRTEGIKYFSGLPISKLTRKYRKSINRKGVDSYTEFKIKSN